ncbi:hypothetical protein [Victivallis sp. Marseille-Q1083]|uniref:nucleotide-binding protein n=1 Tax=Victivallis sp. Marseille-Q1083 TaxID=2717288 RepID=UPI00158D4C78|nr:hypothetical protein [Victivallis sp. Marseille-Q1083]
MGLFLVAGTKGGVGKTLCASMLIDTAIDAGIQVVAYDCDNENQSLTAVFKNSTITLHAIDPENGREAYPLDRVVNELKANSDQEKAFIVDMKAGTSKSTLEWLDCVPVAELAAARIAVNIVGCVTAEVDSCITFLRWLDYCREMFVSGQANLILIRNLIAGQNFWYYEKTLKPVLEEQLPHTRIIEMPFFTPEYLTLSRKAGLTYGQMLRDKAQLQGLQYMQIIRIRKQYEIAAQRFRVLWPEKQTKIKKEVLSLDGGRKQHNA